MATVPKKLKLEPPYQPIYLLFGTQNYLIQRLRRSIVESIPPEDRDLDISIYDLNETSVEHAIEDAMTLSFTGGKRVIILENPIFLTGETKKLKVEHDLEGFMAYVKNPSPDSIIVIEAPYEKLDKRKKLVKELESSSAVYELNQFSDQDLFQLLKDEAAEYGAIYSMDAHQRLLSLVGFHVAQLVNEVQKLSLYVGENGEIDLDAVNLLATRSLESNVFDLVDHVMRGKTDEALFMLQDLYKQKEEPIKLLALVTRQVRILLQTQLFLKQGFTQKEAATKLRLHPYAIKVAADQGRRFNSNQLKQALIWCSDADYSMKAGTAEKDLTLQLLIHRISRLSR